jgi:hypothetical protein
MKKAATIFLPLTAAIIFLSFNTPLKVDVIQQVNPVVGDISYVIKFGHMPDAAADNDIRTRTHLAFVEGVLRQKEVSHLTIEEQEKRSRLLDLLQDYWTAGIFPRNYDYESQRIPCFIDKDGRICAVGYLVEQTAGRHAAEQINSMHKYESIFAMNDASVDEWIAGSGLTKEECAMIQPTYGPSPAEEPDYISTRNGIVFSVFSGANLALSTVNGIQIGKGRKSNGAAIAGLITGGVQALYGAGMMPHEQNGNNTNGSLKTLCFVNIGLGTMTMILSTCNLIPKREKNSSLSSWNIYGIPAQDNGPGLIFSLARRF